MTGIQMRMALFASAYFLTNSLTISLTRFQNGLALVWFGAAIGAIWLLTLPREKWHAALFWMAGASMLATSLFGFGPRLAAPIMIANVIETWILARLLLFARPQRDWLDNVSGLAILIVVGGIVAPVLSGIAGGLAVSYVAPGGWLWHWSSWVTAHGLGTLLGFPIVHLLASQPSADAQTTRNGGKSLECLCHCAITFAVAALVFDEHRLPLLFLPIVPVLFTAFRCGRGGAALGTVIVGAVASFAVHNDSSVIATLGFSPAAKTIFLQFYLVTVSLLAIPTSVALRQHQLVVDELAYRKAIKRLIAEHSDDALINLDEAGLVRFASPAGERLTGLADLEGKPLAVFFDPLDSVLVADALQQARVTPEETVVIERPVVRGDTELWLEAKLRTAASSGDGPVLRGFAVTIRDITERKRGELEAIREAETDALTGLPNRRVLLRHLERAIANAGERPMALAILDLDHFKRINDTHGHLVGDDVLRRVSTMMRSFDAPNRLFARLGGEEFALIDMQSDFAASEALCEELRGAVAAIMHRTREGVRLSVTTSVGLVPVDRPQGVSEALTAADRLLYRAKSDGRNRVVTPFSARPSAATKRAA